MEGQSPQIYCFTIFGAFLLANKEKVIEQLNNITDWRVEERVTTDRYMTKNIRTVGWNEVRLMQMNTRITNTEVEYIKTVLDSNYYIYRPCQAGARAYSLFTHLDFRPLQYYEIKQEVRSNLRFQIQVHLIQRKGDHEEIEIRQIGLSQIDRRNGIAATIATKLKEASLIQLWENKDLLTFRPPETFANPETPKS